MLVVHHIIADAWALQLLSTDLNAALQAALELSQSQASFQPELLSAGTSTSYAVAVCDKLTARLGRPPLQQMDYSVWLCNEMVRNFIPARAHMASMFHARPPVWQEQILHTPADSALCLMADCTIPINKFDLVRSLQSSYMMCGGVARIHVKCSLLQMLRCQTSLESQRVL